MVGKTVKYTYYLLGKPYYDIVSIVEKELPNSYILECGTLVLKSAIGDYITLEVIGEK